MLDFAWKLTTTPHLVDDADRDALSQQGLSQEDIFDLAETVAFFNLSNRMASAADMIPNQEYHGTRANWDMPTQKDGSTIPRHGGSGRGPKRLASDGPPR